MPFMRTLLTVAAALTLTACAAPTPEPEAAPEPAPTRTTAPRVEPEPEPEPEGPACENVDQVVLDRIAQGAQDGVGLALTRGAAIKSEQFEKAYLVAAEYTAEGVDPSVAVWFTNSIDPTEPGMMMSADATAKALTVWPDAAATDAALSAADPEVIAARDCL